MAQFHTTKSYIPAEDTQLLEPFYGLIAASNKKNYFASDTFRLYNFWLNVSQDNVDKIGNILALQYYGGALLDDFLDSSLMRQGVPSGYRVYGIAKIVNVSNYILNVALQTSCELKNSKAIDIYIEHHQLSFGAQGTELYWRDNGICPTEEEYMRLNTTECVAYYSTAVYIMQLFSTNQEINFRNLIRRHSEFIIIYGDFANLYSTTYSAAKGGYDDIRAGTCTFPIIYAINNKKYGSKVWDIMKQKTHNVDLQKQCFNLIKKCGSFEYTVKSIEDKKEETMKEVLLLGGYPEFGQALKILVDLYDTNSFML